MDSSPLKIGVSYENNTDLVVLNVLLSRMSKPGEYEIVRNFPCRTGVLGYVEYHTKLFFMVDKVDLAIFITDQDNSQNGDRFETAIKNIERVDPVHVLASVVAICNPHIEKWLVTDHNAVKKIFDLDHSKPIPKATTPKKIIELARDMQETQLSKQDTYEALAREVDMGVLIKLCPDFKNFYEQIHAKSKGIFIIE